GHKPDITVKKIMETDLITIEKNSPIKKAIRKMAEQNIEHLLVEENGEISIVLLHTVCNLQAPVENNDLDSYEDLSPYEWETSTLEEQGLNSLMINSALSEMYGMSYYYSFLIIRNGYLVVEQYYNGRTKYVMDPIYSVTKSYISAVIGIAIEEGYIESIDSKLLDFFPEYTNEITDSSKFDITIRHLLTMTSGFDQDTNISDDVEHADNMIASILTSDLQSDPGSDFLYSTYGTHLLSGIIEKTTGKSTLVYTSESLLAPLGINAVMWSKDQNDVYFGGAGMFLTPRDMARLGYLYLKNGTLDEEQIIPSTWIEKSITNHRNYTTEWSEMEEVGYGYLWWTGKLRGYRLFFASGLGGQSVIVFPELNMVIVTTMDATYEEGSNQIQSFIHILDNYILPAVEDTGTE
ncbi:MAG: serine hydrolase, partial [bacterium]